MVSNQAKKYLENMFSEKVLAPCQGHHLKGENRKITNKIPCQGKHRIW